MSKAEQTRGIEHSLLRRKAFKLQDTYLKLSAMWRPEPLIPKFRELGVPHCMIVAALFEDTLSQLDSRELLRKDLNWQFLARVGRDLMKAQKYNDAVKLLEFSDEIVRFKWITELHRNDYVPVFDLLRRGTQQDVHGDLLRGWFGHAVTSGETQVFKLLLLSEHANVQTVVADYLRGSYEFVFRSLVFNTVVCMKSQLSDYIECLNVACKAGLLSGLDREPGFRARDCKRNSVAMWALRKAIDFNQPDLVRLFHRYGAGISHAELYQLSKDRSAPPPGHQSPLVSNRDDAKAIEEFLSSKASEPLSLKVMCFRYVSRRIGWGRQREQIVNQLEIVEGLKDELNPLRELDKSAGSSQRREEDTHAQGREG